MTLKNKNPYPNETTQAQRIDCDQATAHLETLGYIGEDAVQMVNGGEG